MNHTLVMSEKTDQSWAKFKAAPLCHNVSSKKNGILAGLPIHIPEKKHIPEASPKTDKNSISDDFILAINKLADEYKPLEPKASDGFYSINEKNNNRIKQNRSNLKRIFIGSIASIALFYSIFLFLSYFWFDAPSLEDINSQTLNITQNITKEYLDKKQPITIISQKYEIEKQNDRLDLIYKIRFELSFSESLYASKKISNYNKLQEQFYKARGIALHYNLNVSSLKNTLPNLIYVSHKKGDAFYIDTLIRFKRIGFKWRPEYSYYSRKTPSISIDGVKLSFIEGDYIICDESNNDVINSVVNESKKYINFVLKKSKEIEDNDDVISNSEAKTIATENPLPIKDRVEENLTDINPDSPAVTKPKP